MPFNYALKYLYPILVDQFGSLYVISPFSGIHLSDDLLSSNRNPDKEAQIETRRINPRRIRIIFKFSSAFYIYRKAWFSLCLGYSFYWKKIFGNWLVWNISWFHQNYQPKSLLTGAIMWWLWSLKEWNME